MQANRDGKALNRPSRVAADRDTQQTPGFPREWAALGQRTWEEEAGWGHRRASNGEDIREKPRTEEPPPYRKAKREIRAFSRRPNLKG